MSDLPISVCPISVCPISVFPLFGSALFSKSSRFEKQEIFALTEFKLSKLRGLSELWFFSFAHSFDPISVCPMSVFPFLGEGGTSLIIVSQP